MYKLTGLFILLSSNLLWGQFQPGKRADRLFREEAYVNSAPIFQNLMKQKMVIRTPDVYTKYLESLAICHFKLGDSKSAANELTELIEIDQPSIYSLSLALQAYKMNGEYEKVEKTAQEAFKQFPMIFFQNHIQLKKELDNIKGTQATFTLVKSKLNHESGGMAACVFGNDIYFCSRALPTRNISPTFRWDGKYFYHLRKGTEETGFKGSEQLMTCREGHCGPAVMYGSGTKMLLTRNFSVSKHQKANVPLGLFFYQKIQNEWIECDVFPWNSPHFNVGQGVLDKGDTLLYFTSDMPGGYGGTDLYVSHYRNGTWQKPTNLGGKINTSQDESFPWIEAGKLFFASNGHIGFGGLDIFQTDVSKLDTVFNLGTGINSCRDDFAMITTDSFSMGYITSNREGKEDQIYLFERTKPNIQLKFEFTLNGELLQDSISLAWASNNIPDSKRVVSNEKISLEENTMYNIQFNLEKYHPIEAITFSTHHIRKDTTIRYQIDLQAISHSVPLHFFDAHTGKTIDSVSTWMDGNILKTDHNQLTWKMNQDSMSFFATKKGYLDLDTIIPLLNRTDSIHAAMIPVREGLTFELDDIYYDFNKSSLRPESMVSLNRLVDFLKMNPMKVELSSHTDVRGSAVYNQKLSEERAKSCVTYLIKMGVPADQLIPKGYGESKPLLQCSSEDCPEEVHQKNRRTEIKIIRL